MLQIKANFKNRHERLETKSTIWFHTENAVVIQSRIFAYLRTLGAIETQPHYWIDDEDYGVVRWDVGDDMSGFEIRLVQSSKPKWEVLCDGSILDPAHVDLVLKELIDLRLREPGVVEEVPVPALDRRGLYAIRDDYWPSLQACVEKRTPVTTFRRFSTDRDALQFELNELQETEECDAKCHSDEIALAYRFDEVTGAMVVEMYGPLLPEGDCEQAIRRAA